MAGIRILQANLQHSRAASAALTVHMRDFDVALIQKPWINRVTSFTTGIYLMRQVAQITDT
ncbi:hypothetical protein NQ318_000865 [Aromia moschata]|uniref:Uncharacterized protein n=1 Tax=Aromia moschata TaxID=1265417 RepID=A0AAV8XQE0_9CUCU|nr:hypothetical protein NQ318_000865 [Aromia moschata]